MTKNRKQGFGIFFDPSKSTSGQRFFGDLYQELVAEAQPLDKKPEVVLFNISAPWKLILRSKLNRQKVVLRVDGLYSDKLCPAFLNSFNWPLRQLLTLGIRFKWTHFFFATLANLLNQNYTGFLRILFADQIIYQSEFSKQMYQHYFPRKPYSIIVNGFKFKSINNNSNTHVSKNIRLVTIYDEWRPQKRMRDIISFAQWANETRKIPIHLTIIGYTGKPPFGSSPAMKEALESSSYIRTLPRFNTFSKDLSKELAESDIYLSFSYRDACPNVVIEAMAHGIPVVGIGSGGVTDIVGAAGILIPTNDFENGLFTAQRYEHDFPPIDFEHVLEAIQTVMGNYAFYKAKVEERFKMQLDIEVVAQKYADVLRQPV